MNFITIKYYYTHKNRISRISNNTLLDFCVTMLLILQIYIYLYTAAAAKQYILLYSNKLLRKHILKNIAFISACCWTRSNKNLKSLTNTSLTENKLLISKWLKYLLFTYKNIKNFCRISFQHTKKLYNLYYKINNKYKNIFKSPTLPYTFILINNTDKRELQNLINLHRTIIYINPKEINFSNKQYTKSIKVNNKTIYYVNNILNIIVTSLIHGGLL